MNTPVGSQLAHNVGVFCRLLRNAGLPVSTGQVRDSLAAVNAVGIERRDDWHAALRCTLTRHPDHFAIFDRGL